MFKRTLLLCVVLLVMLLLCEAGLRLSGKMPHQDRPYSFKTTPENSYVTDSLLGTRLGVGSFNATINSGLSYSTNHVITGSCVTRKIYDSAAPVHVPRIDFHGCSFTYGMGVNDTQTYPCLFAKDAPGYAVCNYGCPGYRTLEALLILKKQKAHNDLPQVAVINYLDFHDDRNAGTSVWREGVQEGFLASKNTLLSKEYAQAFDLCKIPFADISEDILNVNWFSVNALYHKLPGRNYLSLIYLCEKAINKELYNNRPPAQVTNGIFLEIQKFCYENHVKFLVTTMSSGQRTKDVQAFLTANNIRWIDISIDFSNKLYTNFPYDGHPSPLAHSLFAKKLIEHSDELKQ